MTGDKHGPPKKAEGQPPQGQPSTNTSSDQTANKDESSAYIRGLGLRRAASYRLPVHDRGKADPWWYEPPGERGYEAAAHHLLGHGLLPGADREGLRVMYRRGGHSRQAAELIARAWELAS